MIFAVLLATSPSSTREAAPPEAVSPEPPAPRVLSWYGWQNILADGVGIGVLIAGARSDSNLMLGVALANYLVTSPTIHFAHGDARQGLGSIALRLGIPLILGIVGQSSCGKGGDCLSGVLGIGLGAPIAMVIDDVVLSFHTEPAPQPRILPTVTMIPGRDGHLHAAPALSLRF
ncbi:MAG TPA: hypothetical protein VGH20_05830 [Myxococcales bacterium]